jgi:hypothetical protein
MTVRKSKLLALSLLLVGGAPALACTVCNSESGAAIRSAIVQQNAPFSLAAVALPFVATLGAMTLLKGKW